ncbi:MAG: biopolymer transporter ExbD [Porticoccaceae bacterium]
MDVFCLYNSRRNRISLTPLIDVVFILLMFFMLTSSFTREKQLELSAPVASQELQVVTEVERLVVGASGGLESLRSAGQELSDDRLRELLADGRPVVLQPRREATVQNIVSAMSHLRELGVSRLSLANLYEKG